MDEIWKDVDGFEGLYQVSNMGRVKSFKKWKRAGSPDEYILKNCKNNRGYHTVTLYRGKERHKFLVHRLVASAFIPNPNDLPHINHMDENIDNNNADNLEWCTPQYNNCYGTARFRQMLTTGTPVKQALINGTVIATYRTTTIAQEITGISRKEIAACVRGHLATAGGFIWSKNESPSGI